MKTREQIYSGEASDLLRNIAMYKTLYESQIHRFYPGKQSVINNLLTHLVRQGRIYRSPDKMLYSASFECSTKTDTALLASVWVLLDFIEKVEYHSACDFPVKLCFFAGGEAYEVIYVQFDHETLMNHILAGKRDADARRIVLVDTPEQIEAIDIPGTTGYCCVDAGGAVEYYKYE